MNPTVVDTSVASFILRDDPLARLYQPYLSGSTLFISFQTVAEMRLGGLKANWGPVRVNRLERFFHSFNRIGYSDELGNYWAKVMNEAHRAGRRLEAGDGWIAATARYLNAPLLTHDRDFSFDACPSIKVIRVSA